MSELEMKKGGPNWLQFALQVLSALIAALTASAGVNAANLLFL